MQQVSCTLDSGQIAERRKRWDELTERSFVERVETEDGLRLMFRREEGVEAELRELARLESECCAFAGWTVDVVDGRVRLGVAGRGTETVAAVRGMFRSIRG